MARDWSKAKEVATRFVKFEKVGDSLEGVIVSRAVQTFRKDGKETEVGRYNMVTDDAEEITFIGSTALDDKLVSVPDGVAVQITYTGDIKTSSGNRLKDFKVLVDA